MERYAHLGVLTAMLHDRTTGRVEPDGDLGLAIDYWPSGHDRAELMLGLRACAQLLFAAGARRVLIPTHPAIQLDSVGALGRLDNLQLEKGLMDVMAVHPMSTVPMGDNPRVAAVRSNGRHHSLKGLWMADGSLFPTSIGGPPQLSVYALGLHVGQALVASGQ
jgi:choline dehydrogenase-like flavoprotein